MAWSVSPQSVEYTDDDKLDMLAAGRPYLPDGWEPPDYPTGLLLTLCKADLEAIGAPGGEPKNTLNFRAKGKVTSTFKSADECRIEIRLSAIASDTGKFHEIGAHKSTNDGPTPDFTFNGPSICLCGPELEKIALADDAERGDMITLIGTARFESRSDTEWGGDCVTLQITHLTYEDKGAASRKG